MVQKNSSVVGLALLLALFTALEPRLVALATTSSSSEPLPASFSLPDSVPEGTTVRIDGSSSMAAVNQALKQQFESEYSGTEVTLATNGTRPALEALRNGEIDLAAIGRPLTDEEKAQGLVEVPLARQKIAMIVGADNPFTGSLTDEQFARMFRGEISSWSEVGGPAQPIRFIDLPETSDTRNAFRNYPVFQSAPFVAGATAVALSEDSTDAVIEALGTDGIGYSIANQVLDRPGVRIVSMHQTPPTDPRYPFSQPLVYVYSGTPSPAVQSFLGFAAAPAAQQAIAAARAIDAPAAGAAGGGGTATAVSPAISPAAPAETAIAESPATAADPTDTAMLPPAAAEEATRTGLPWLWWLLPLALLGLLFWWLSRRRSEPTPSYEPVTAPPRPVEPATSDPVTPLPDADRRADVVPGIIGGTLAAGAGAAALANQDREPLAPTADPWETAEEPAAEAAMTPVVPDPVLPAPIVEPVPSEPVLPEPEPAVAAEPIAGPIVESAAIEPVADLPPVPSPNLAEASLMSDAVVEWEADGVPEVSAAAEEAAAISVPEPIEAEPPAANLLDEAAIAAAAAAAVVGAAITDDSTDKLEANAPAVEASTQTFEEVPLMEAPTDLPEPAAAPMEELVSELPDEVESVTIVETVQMEAVVVEDSEPIAVIEETETIVIDPVAEDAAPIVIAEETIVIAVDEPLESAALSDAAIPVTGAAALSVFSDDRSQSDVEAAKYDVGQTDLSTESLAAVDEGLPDLPDGYGDSRIVLMPRDPQWLYVYWDVPNEHKEELRRQGGQRLALRWYDVTDVDFGYQNPHSLQQCDCDELARDWYIPVPVSDRDYIAEIGYLTPDGRWLMLARSAPVRVPPVYPSDWFEDQFATIGWEEDLRGRTIMDLVPPSLRAALAAGGITTGNAIYDAIFGMAQSAEAQRVAGSLFGSMQMLPEQAISSYVLPSGMGMMAVGGAVPGLPTMSGIGMSGVGMMMSGVGFSASMPPIRPRQFWLVADAELIVYGATEPDATVTIGGRPIKLNPDGTFRFQMSFQDGLIDYPIMAMAADGEQTRSVHMKFTRETPERNTNTKDEAVDEWLF